MEYRAQLRHVAHDFRVFVAHHCRSWRLGADPRLGGAPGLATTACANGVAREQNPFIGLSYYQILGHGHDTTWIMDGELLRTYLYPAAYLEGTRDRKILDRGRDSRSRVHTNWFTL